MSAPMAAYAHGLAQSLALLRYEPGERFELAKIADVQGRKIVESAVFTNDEGGRSSAVAWITERDGTGNLYIGSNPIRGDAALSGRPKDEDVALVRTLLIDCDPEDTSPGARAAAAALAEDVRAFLERRDVVPPLIDSGRGRQLLLPTPPLPTSEP